MYLSPLSKARRQRDMNNQRIGHPQENLTNKVLIPGIFDVPSEQHYHPSTGFVQCVVTRVGNNLYHFSHQGSGAVETVSIIGSKLKSSRTSNYHLFDSIRGGMSAKLTKKSGHYIGKLRRDKDKPIGCYTLYNASREKQELAAFVYTVPSVFEQVKEGQPPRKMRAILPKCVSSGNDKENSSTAASSNANRLVEHLHNGTWKHQKLLAVETKAPKFHEGQYRLNFSGRVQTPSVKNMQLENEQGEVLLQFGKVDEQRFHLDYKAPFTAISSFSAALCQFDL